MLILITYDVSVTTPEGRKRLRHIAEHCLDYGMRVQNSVFECEVEPGQFAQLKNNLLTTYNEQEDSLRFYFLGKKGREKIEHHGNKAVEDVANDSLII